MRSVRTISTYNIYSATCIIGTRSSNFQRKLRFRRTYISEPWSSSYLQNTIFQRWLNGWRKYNFLRTMTFQRTVTSQRALTLQLVERLAPTTFIAQAALFSHRHLSFSASCVPGALTYNNHDHNLIRTADVLSNYIIRDWHTDTFWVKRPAPTKSIAHVNIIGARSLYSQRKLHFRRTYILEQWSA